MKNNTTQINDFSPLHLSGPKQSLHHRHCCHVMLLSCDNSFKLTSSHGNNPHNDIPTEPSPHWWISQAAKACMNPGFWDVCMKFFKLMLGRLQNKLIYCFILVVKLILYFIIKLHNKSAIQTTSNRKVLELLSTGYINKYIYPNYQLKFKM